MPSRSDVSLVPPSPRDTALLSEVLANLGTQLAEPPTGEPPPPGIAELISAAISELHRISPPTVPLVGGVAPVLGSGVLQELLRCSREPQASGAGQGAAHLDERR